MGLEKLKAFKTLAGVKGNFGLVDAILFISILCYKFAERVQGSMFRVLGSGFPAAAVRCPNLRFLSVI
jgi:hypothetical protein